MRATTFTVSTRLEAMRAPNEAVMAVRASRPPASYGGDREGGRRQGRRRYDITRCSVTREGDRGCSHHASKGMLHKGIIHHLNPMLSSSPLLIAFEADFMASCKIGVVIKCLANIACSLPSGVNLMNRWRETCHLTFLLCTPCSHHAPVNAGRGTTAGQIPSQIPSIHQV